MQVFPFSHLRRAACILAVGSWMALAVGSCSAARADGDLILELPPSEAAIAARAAQQKVNAPIPAPNRQAGRSVRQASQQRGNFSSRGGIRRERVLGTLGMLTQATPIFRERSRQTRVLVKAAAGTYIALKAEAGDWYGVLMADGSLGWVARANVREMAYQVVSSGNAVTMPSGVTDDGDIYPRSDAPYFTGNSQELLNEAYRYMGVRYVWGGSTANGIDCSGFVKNVFAAQGYNLPRLGSEQMAYGVPVPKDQLQAGDRLYFGRRHDRVGVTHTGIYIGDGYFIHSSSSRHGVAVSHLSEPMFQRIYVCARR